MKLTPLEPFTFCLVVTAAFLGACDAPPAERPCVHCQPSCPSPDEAPLRLPDGGHRCTRVGAAPGTAAVTWPDATGAAEPVVYVGPTTGPRTPSGEAPSPDLVTALARTPQPATVLLARGTHTLPATLRVSGPITIRGTGAGQTVLVGPDGADAIHVRAMGSDVLAVSVQGFTVRFGGSDAGSASSVGIRASGASARVTLRDVEISRAQDGLRVEAGATLCAEGLTVTRASGFGVRLDDGSHGWFRRLAVREGGGGGVFARRSHLVVDTGLVADNARDGVGITGTVTSDACATHEDCAPLDACLGFRHERRCEQSFAVTSDGVHPAIPAATFCRSVSVLSNVALLRNRISGLRAERALPQGDERADYVRNNSVLAAPGPNVRVERAVIAGTRPAEGPRVTVAGVLVGPTATVTFDPDITTEARQAAGSEIVDNDGIGVLADGDPFGPDGGFAIGEVVIPRELVRAGTLDLSGALVGSNHGPGVFVQNRAVAERVAYSRLDDNRIFGLAVASGGLRLGQCDQFINTRQGTFPATTPGATPFQAGDGVALQTAARPEAWRTEINTLFFDSEFSRNARAGLLVGDNPVTFRNLTPQGNRGDGNEYGVAYSDTTRMIFGDLPRIRGRSGTDVTLTTGTPVQFAPSVTR